MFSFLDKFILLEICVIYGNIINKKTTIYPAYLKLGKLKNHNKKIKINVM